MRRRSAFTLIELLVVIAIIAILAAILFPVFSAAREKAREATSLSNVDQLGLAIYQYVEDSDELYPQTSFWNPAVGTYSWRVAIQPYLKSWDVFTDPSNPLAQEPNSANGWFLPGDDSHVSYGANSDSMWYEPAITLYDSSYAKGGGAVNACNPVPAAMTPMTSWASWTGSAATPPTNLAQIGSPSSLILIGEVDTLWNWADVEWNEYDESNCTETYPTHPVKLSDCAFPPNVFSGHNGLATYVFCDGHAKAMSIPQTVYPVNLWSNPDVENNVPADQAAQTYAAWAQSYWNLE